MTFLRGFLLDALTLDFLNLCFKKGGSLLVIFVCEGYLSEHNVQV